MDPKPCIMAVDDRPAGLAALRDALARRFGADYRVAGHTSAAAALAELERSRDAGEDVALVIADLWMPEMTGNELLVRAHELHPSAKRALLVGWGDRRAQPAILQGCAFGQLDNYILKPWSPPEVHLYPEVGAFLTEWTGAHRPSMELVRLVAPDPSRRGHELHALLERNGIPHGYYDAGSPEGRRLMADTGLDGSRLPAVVFLDGTVLLDPSNTELSDALGATDLVERQVDLVVVGAGPAGLAAAVYSASEGLQTVVIEREAVGGQAGTSSLIRNYLGFPRGISGAQLAQRAYQQAWLFGTKYVFAREVACLRAEGAARLVTLSDGRELSARAVLIATGATYKRLAVPELERLVGAGVYYSAGLEARLMLGRDVFVAGGGNSAGQAVTHLAQSARSVTLAVRADALERGMSDYLVRQIRHLPNVSVRLNTEIVGGGGDDRLNHLVVRDHAGETEETVRTDALFIFIGAVPHTDWLAGVVARDRNGFLLTGADVGSGAAWPLTRPPLRFETSMPGVFAVGDVRMGSVKRVASAVGEGSMAVHSLHEYLAVASGAARAASPHPPADLRPTARRTPSAPA